MIFVYGYLQLFFEKTPLMSVTRLYFCISVKNRYIISIGESGYFMTVTLKIATKHWALSLGVGIHHIGGGAAIAIAIVIRLAYLQRFILNIGTLR